MVEKKTLAVRMGLNFSKRYHFILIMSAFILMILYSVIKNLTVFGYLYLLSLPVFVWHLNYVMKNDGKSLDKHMKVISTGTMLFSVLGGVGLILG